MSNRSSQINDYAKPCTSEAVMAAGARYESPWKVWLLLIFFLGCFGLLLGPNAWAEELSSSSLPLPAPTGLRMVVEPGSTTPDSDVAWEECRGTEFEPGTSECRAYIAGFNRAWTTAEENIKEVTSERQIDVINLLIMIHEMRLDGIEDDRAILLQLRDQLDKALSALPADKATEVAFLELTVVGAQISSEIQHVREEKRRVEETILFFHTILPKE